MPPPTRPSSCAHLRWAPDLNTQLGPGRRVSGADTRAHQPEKVNADQDGKWNSDELSVSTVVDGRGETCSQGQPAMSRVVWRRERGPPAGIYCALFCSYAW